MQGSYKTAAAILTATAVILAAVIPAFLEMSKPEPIKKGPNVTRVKMLSDYSPGLLGSPGDTEVYILDSGKPGGTAMVLGGTHPNEPAGFLSAILLVENARPTAGRLIVIPRANASAFAHTDYQEASPRRFSIKTPAGERWFRYGSRATSPTHQWPDPDIYIHAASGQKLSGSETRNLNRAYPGSLTGNLTEQIAYAITQVIIAEKADLSIDLHEASPEYPVVNAIVAHDRAMPIAAEVAMNLGDAGIKIGLEPSPDKLRGLSHREWGDTTGTLAILMETANPSQGRLRGVTDANLVLKGRDEMYYKAAKLGRLFVPFPEEGIPISERVARHVAAIDELIRIYSLHTPQSPVTVDNIPGYRDIVTRGIGQFM